MTPEFIESLGWVLSYLVIVVAAIFVIRQVVLWYFRLGEIADNIAYIANHYRTIDHAARQRREQEAQRSIQSLGNQSRVSK